jgi:sister chromatid cohesion protein PDS5
VQAISSFFPSLLSGLEEDIVELLKEDNEVLKEGIAHVLSKAGVNIREQLASTRSNSLRTSCFLGSYFLS